MVSTLSIPVVRPAVLTALRNSVALTGYVGLRVYPDTNGDVQEKPAYPFVQVEGGEETPLNTFGAYGKDAFLNVRVATQTRSDTQADTIASIVVGVLDGLEPTVSGYATVSVHFEGIEKLRDSVSGVVTREWIVRFSVTASQ